MADTDFEEMQDICALPLVRRVAAMLDRDPDALAQGDPLPRGWHVALFTVPTPQSQLRPDGLGGLGVTLPDLGLPRIMAGGKRTRFHGDIPIGAEVRRRTRVAAVTPKEGRSGRFTVVGIENEIFAVDATRPVLIEQQDYVMMPERPSGAPQGASRQTPAARTQEADAERRLVPDPALLMRYSAITFNTHRIHYDLPFATEVEGYPALVVNGGLPVAFLLELFREIAGRQPSALAIRNVAPLFCGDPIRLAVARSDTGWRLWAEDQAGRLAVEVLVE